MGRARLLRDLGAAGSAGLAHGLRPLGLEGDDQRLRPLEARREALMRLVDGVDGMLFSEALAAEGAIVFV